MKLQLTQENSVVKNSRENKLAGLRGIAVFLVVGSHLGLAGKKHLGFLIYPGLGNAVLFYFLF